MSSNELNDINPQAEAIFFEAIELGDEKDRQAFIAKRCNGDHALLKTVESMLEDLPKATHFFEKSARALNIPLELLPDEELKRGVEVGPYRILELLGEGGSSKVYEAEQEFPVSRRVAFKVLKLGMDTCSVIKRFESERQTLAMLEHPNICRVFDAGTTSTGRPFFVMERVQGTRITDYCKHHALTIEARLTLMSQVCSAVQHAHNKGIIHRDIKPSNILISEIDGQPVPKLIDFGIAKATYENASDGKTLLGHPIGTPAYMSPEQFAIGEKDIDTRSDIYSIGIVLYELLSGNPPFDNDDLIGTGFEAMRKRILLDVPPRPLAKNKSLTKNATKEELNWIAMKAIEKDREQRYATADAFASDLKSYLQNEPVKAHPPSRLYKLRKLIFRNQLASLSIATAVVTLVVGLTISMMLFNRASKAEREQTRLREIAEERANVTKAAIYIMQNKMREAEDEISAMGGMLTQPSLEATNVFRTLAIWNATNGNWKTSADRWLAMLRVNDFDAEDMTEKVSENLLPIAPVLLKTNDLVRYREFQQFLIQRLGATNHPYAAEHLLKLCLLVPASKSILNQLSHAASVAEQSMSGDFETTPEDWMEAWRCIALALWHYRNRNFEKAVSWCDRAILRDDWEKARKVQAIFIKAMCYPDESIHGDFQEALKNAEDFLDLHLQQPLYEMQDGYFHDWLIADILRKEWELQCNP